GVALTGSEFFYPNPLASGADYKRSPWFGCACCPVNVVRFLPELAGYFYATRDSEAYVNLFAAGTARLIVAKTPVDLRQETRYPWDGKVTITVTPQTKVAFTLNVRIPGWARNEPVPSDLYRYDDGLKPEVKLTLNGQPVALVLKKGFAKIHRTWQTGDKIELDLPMPVRLAAAHPQVKDDVDRWAVERGPLVYCAEGTDNGGKVLTRVLSKDPRFEVVPRPNLLGGIVAVKIIPPGQDEAITMIPYCLWENRGPNEMTVWFRTRPAPWDASWCFPADSIEACFNGRVPKSSTDEYIPRMTWWDPRAPLNGSIDISTCRPRFPASNSIGSTTPGTAAAECRKAGGCSIGMVISGSRSKAPTITV
ncbi:MAG: beta-L-arabinofuranosidase domain-containing protein, partial [Thermoguttaceae bacterium]